MVSTVMWKLSTSSDTASSIHTGNPKPWMLVEWQVPRQQVQKLMLQLQTLDTGELEQSKILLCFFPKISQVCEKAIAGNNVLPHFWSFVLYCLIIRIEKSKGNTLTVFTKPADFTDVSQHSNQ